MGKQNNRQDYQARRLEELDIEGGTFTPAEIEWLQNLPIRYPFDAKSWYRKHGGFEKAIQYLTKKAGRSLLPEDLYRLLKNTGFFSRTPPGTYLDYIQKDPRGGTLFNSWVDTLTELLHSTRVSESRVLKAWLEAPEIMHPKYLPEQAIKEITSGGVGYGGPIKTLFSSATIAPRVAAGGLEAAGTYLTHALRGKPVSKERLLEIASTPGFVQTLRSAGLPPSVATPLGILFDFLTPDPAIIYGGKALKGLATSLKTSVKNVRQLRSELQTIQDIAQSSLPLKVRQARISGRIEVMKEAYPGILQKMERLEATMRMPTPARPRVEITKQMLVDFLKSQRGSVPLPSEEELRAAAQKIFKVYKQYKGFFFNKEKNPLWGLIEHATDPKALQAMVRAEARKFGKYRPTDEPALKEILDRFSRTTSPKEAWERAEKALEKLPDTEEGWFQYLKGGGKGGTPIKPTPEEEMAVTKEFVSSLGARLEKKELQDYEALTFVRTEIGKFKKRHRGYSQGVHDYLDSLLKKESIPAWKEAAERAAEEHAQRTAATEQLFQESVTSQLKDVPLGALDALRKTYPKLGPLVDVLEKSKGVSAAGLKKLLSPIPKSVQKFYWKHRLDIESHLAQARGEALPAVYRASEGGPAGVHINLQDVNYPHLSLSEVVVPDRKGAFQLVPLLPKTEETLPLRLKIGQYVADTIRHNTNTPAHLIPDDVSELVPSVYVPRGLVKEARALIEKFPHWRVFAPRWKPTEGGVVSTAVKPGMVPRVSKLTEMHPTEAVATLIGKYNDFILPKLLQSKTFKTLTKAEQDVLEFQPERLELLVKEPVQTEAAMRGVVRPHLLNIIRQEHALEKGPVRKKVLDLQARLQKEAEEEARKAPEKVEPRPVSVQTKPVDLTLSYTPEGGEPVYLAARGRSGEGDILQFELNQAQERAKRFRYYLSLRTPQEREAPLPTFQERERAKQGMAVPGFQKPASISFARPFEWYTDIARSTKLALSPARFIADTLGSALSYPLQLGRRPEEAIRTLGRLAGIAKKELAHEVLPGVFSRKTIPEVEESVRNFARTFGEDILEKEGSFRVQAEAGGVPQGALPPSYFDALLDRWELSERPVSGALERVGAYTGLQKPIEPFARAAGAIFDPILARLAHGMARVGKGGEKIAQFINYEFPMMALRDTLKDIATGPGWTRLDRQIAKDILENRVHHNFLEFSEPAKRELLLAAERIGQNPRLVPPEIRWASRVGLGPLFPSWPLMYPLTAAKNVLELRPEQMGYLAKLEGILQTEGRPPATGEKLEPRAAYEMFSPQYQPVRFLPIYGKKGMEGIFQPASIYPELPVSDALLRAAEKALDLKPIQAAGELAGGIHRLWLTQTQFPAWEVVESFRKAGLAGELGGGPGTWLFQPMATVARQVGPREISSIFSWDIFPKSWRGYSGFTPPPEGEQLGMTRSTLDILIGELLGARTQELTKNLLSRRVSIAARSKARFLSRNPKEAQEFKRKIYERAGLLSLPSSFPSR